MDAPRDDRSGGDTPRNGLPRGTTARTARIAALPLAFGGRAVAGWGRRLAGADADAVSAAMMERNAEQLFAVLGQLRGGAMKVGQALAVYESMMPAELAEPYRRALVRLQAQGPPLPARDVHRMLDEQLGRQWRTRLPEFDDVPTAAASIGQVHRARTAQGRPVAVKVQYPGADQALETDLRVLERFARLFTLIVPGLDARAVMRELRARTLEELDYRAEADHQRAFAAEYGGGEHLHVPAVIASAPKVLVSEWLDGTSLARIIGQPAEEGADLHAHDRHGHTIVETMFSSPVRIGLLHADPHPGNFLLLTDGRLGMVDFGATAAMPGGIPPVLARTLRHMADGEREQMMALLRAEGFIHGDIGPDDVLAYIGALADPLRVPRFRFDRAWMAAQGARVADLRGAAYRETGRALTLPADHLVFLRVLTGWMNVLAQLDCTVAVRGIVEKWVPAFAEG
ncbi:ABC1 kinase family protein [Pseudonocardia charpentierae]|uniref:AarF/ABC1/UbiB kinase family protein n=1 Tax=Pseudonocardia charpentierae TaxID=3075545 RepID=A0ABU2NCC4_9PSEU|nr:AarF/ABC1/UbiB kinase family protein [Pseudonocardia sp. DSM 45834]MDT0351602.1 AarF/ABC1/UbiB kinase family protein [Pseudonocardia sp. DSM 45834]